MDFFNLSDRFDNKTDSFFFLFSVHALLWLYVELVHKKVKENLSFGIKKSILYFQSYELPG